MRRDTHVEYSPFYPLVREQFGEDPPAIVGFRNLYNCILFINKPGPLSELFVTKNMYVDKDVIFKVQFAPLFGESSLMSAGSESQARKRKLIGSSFYKDKLLGMIDVIKKNVAEKIESLEKRYLASGEAFDIVNELDLLHTKIILTTAFGMENVAEVTLPYEENGGIV
jgi:cytochrome P450